jgi:serine/threonine-protein kinase RsbW
MSGNPPTAPAWQCHELHTIHDMRHSLGLLMVELQGHGYSDKEQFGIRLSLEEAIVNSIKHGHQGDVSKRVLFRYHVDAQRFQAEIEDEGPGFNPDAVPSPLAPENIELPGGRGVFLMRHYMTEVSFNARGNGVILHKTRESGRNGTPA